jgi:hypothetical protein
MVAEVYTAWVIYGIGTALGGACFSHQRAAQEKLDRISHHFPVYPWDRTDVALHERQEQGRDGGAYQRSVQAPADIWSESLMLILN